MTNSSSPTMLSTTRPKRFSAAPMTITKLFFLACGRCSNGVNRGEMFEADEGQNLFAQAQNFALIDATDIALVDAGDFDDGGEWYCEQAATDAEQ